jgi:hypothetical protein
MFETAEQQRQDAERSIADELRYQRLVRFANKHKLLLGKHKWRPVAKYMQGQINALRKSYGTPRITDGVRVVIERLDGSLYVGHLDWFIETKVEKAKKKSERESVWKELAQELKG